MRTYFSTTFRDYAFIALGILGAACFFAVYPSQDPKSAVDYSLDEENVRIKATQIVSELGYRVNDFDSKVNFKSNKSLLDSLQYDLGRGTVIQKLHERTSANIKPYYWSISFVKSLTGMQQDQDLEKDREARRGNAENEIRLKLDSKGAFIELKNTIGQLPVNGINRKALTAVFSSGNKNAEREIFESISDSLLGRLLYFDLQQETDSLAKSDDSSGQIRNQLLAGRPYRYSVKDAEMFARHYLNQTGWHADTFRLDTVMTERIQSVNTAKVRFRDESTPLQQKLTVDVQVTPAGGLVALEYRYNTQKDEEGGWSFLWPILRSLIIFFFALTGAVMFFFRIRARAIDTRPALVVAVIMGLTIPVYIFLGKSQEIDLFGDTGNWIETVILFVRMGTGGALASLGFFIFFAIGDSITRQYWPEKLFSYNYLRQGMLFNKPVGVMVLRSINLAFILAGLWTLLLIVFPTLFIEVETVLVSDTVGWPPVYLLAHSLWFGFAFVLAVFLVAGGQAYAQTQNYAAVLACTVLASGIVCPVIYDVGPSLQEFFIGSLLGGTLTAVYLRWDFLTVVLTHILFWGLLGTVSGWMIENSPDAYIFLLFLLLMVFLAIVGVFSVLKGKEKEGLPTYIPEYVEELAQEERIKQELQIARQVQQSFLPVQTPDIEGLDIAALCQPAFETGGDYYDFIQLDDHRLVLAIGDVSGKGIQAAFYMTLTKGILHSLCRETDSPAELLKKTNRLFCDNARKGTFISLVYGIIDLNQGTFTFARAGHNPILHVNGENGGVEELKPSGLGIGLTRDQTFENNIEEIKLTLDREDLLVLYTDGIVEALNEMHRFYGERRLIEHLKNQKNKSSQEILTLLADDVSRFTGTAKQHDDMTIMVIKIDGESPAVG